MRRFGLVIIGGGLASARAIKAFREAGGEASFGEGDRLVGAISVAQSRELEILLKDLIAERSPTDALARELVGGRS